MPQMLQCHDADGRPTFGGDGAGRGGRLPESHNYPISRRTTSPGTSGVMAQRPGAELEHGAGLPRAGDEAPGRQLRVDPEHATVVVDEHDVDRDAHEPGVDRPGWRQQQAVAHVAGVSVRGARPCWTRASAPRRRSPTTSPARSDDADPRGRAAHCLPTTSVRATVSHARACLATVARVAAHVRRYSEAPLTTLYCVTSRSPVRPLAP